ncbi:MAG: KR domain-containing protein, partial [Cyanobacteria bacterium J06621_11]
LSPPTVEIVSNVTGTWLTDSEATSPDYWVNHLRHQVRFSQGLTTLQELSNPVFLEIGPGDTLAKFAAQQLCKTPANTDPNRAHVLYSLPHPRENKADVTTLISALGELWKLGIPIDWSRFYQDSKRHRLSLPTYPFERQSYWVPLVSEQRPGQKIEKNPASPIAQSIQQKRTDIADWFYLPSWKRLPLAASSSDMANHGWLVFSGESFQKSLQSYLSTVSGDDALKSAASADAENAPKIIWVNPGKKFSIGEETDPPTRYTIRPHSATDYQQLIQTLISNQQLPDQVVYGWHLNVTNVATDYINDFKAMVGLTQALAQLKHRLTLSLLTTDAYSVAGRGSTNPSKAKSIGFTQSITQEYPHIGCRILEVESFSYTMEHSGLQQLYQELLTPYHASQRQIAYRGYHRWVQTYEAFPIPKIDRSPGLKQNGTYLIAGDLVEGLGMIYAQALVQNYDAKLILLGRAGLPPVEEWEKWLVTHSPQHSVSQFIRKLQALGQINEQFLWFSGNLAEVSWVEESIEAGVAKFGRISGVFHAGVMGDRASCSIAELTEDECDRICRTKVEGIQTLQQTLAESEIDFYLLQSSLAAVVGGVGFGAYAAANAYLDAFAIEQSKVSPNTTWLSLNWDACTLEGRPEPSQINSTARDHSHSELMSLAMSPDEVWETTQRALASAQPRLTQLVISPRPLANRLKAAFTPSAEQSSTVTASESENSSSINPQANPPEHSRPATVTTEYVAPRTAVEQTVAKEMGELLGIEAVGIYDNFFELGGHSLLAIQAVTKLRKEFPVELPMRAFLFGSPTVAGIAKIIEEQIEENNQEKASQEKDVQSESMQLENVQAEATQANELATLSVENQATIESLLDQIEEMTPEEVKNEV